MSECPHGLFDVCCTNYERCTLGAPKKEWVGLTDEEIKEILDCGRPDLVNIKKAEQKLKEKNT
jgi:predicted transglutaminase-like cysteine proteinase